MKELPTLGFVRKFHHNLQNKDLKISFNDLKPTPPSSQGKHKFNYDAQCLLLPQIELLQNNCAKSLCSLLMTKLGGLTAESKCMGIL